MRTREEQEAINKVCKYHPEDYYELEELVADREVNLGDIDTSRITDMSNLFFLTNRKDFSGIDKWDTSNVTNMRSMFLDCTDFNQPLNDWDVSHVKDMANMFAGCEKFNEPLNDWDVSNVKMMLSVFKKAKEFNQNLNDWVVREDCDCSNAFQDSNLSYENVKEAFTTEQLLASAVNGADKIITAQRDEKLQLKKEAWLHKRGR